ncbi:hypothetical protein [Pseudoduganella namucuonensis]|uniref:Uncharacterized protein n=1 Tax=Pseudoduganella namucuonensis TaxID=1035707 RepID=A0A1I7M420_9BURK|nr:hypothetical protein [Pseudoduganella namucuonensis]SFV16560.1 hypothetical protein SAMN05216552_105321 [Pseudoduganella namucuonensis]
MIRSSALDNDRRELKRGALVSTYEQQTIRFDRDIAELAPLYTGPRLAPNTGALTYQRVRSASPDIDENLGAEEKKKTPPR